MAALIRATGIDFRMGAIGPSVSRRQYYACLSAGRLRPEGRPVPRYVTGALERLRVAGDRLLEAACRLSAEAVLPGGVARPADRECTSLCLAQLCGQGDGRACHSLAVIRLSPAFGTPDPDAATQLLARNCVERDFSASCEPFCAFCNSSLPQPSASRASDMNRVFSALESLAPRLNNDQETVG